MQQCKQLSVTLDIDGKLGFGLVNIHDIIFFEYDNLINRIIIHTMNKKYYTMSTLKYFIESLNNSGYFFKLVDRNNAVNIDKIVCLDSRTKKAYFEWPTHTGSKNCTFSGKHFDEVMKLLSSDSIVIA
ncbi:LytTR family DNA-binding domain-containing protein [Paenibacillus spongiae]|uniref:LytTR family DNA-binding domain-containing protein n=1 Tax=Paenibacillus spongiae TaxID=2909671 RepID=UPI0035A24DDF